MLIFGSFESFAVDEVKICRILTPNPGSQNKFLSASAMMRDKTKSSPEEVKSKRGFINKQVVLKVKLSDEEGLRVSCLTW